MSGLNKDDIIRKFLDLHPDTPIDGQEYAIPLRIVSRMLEVAATAEREACAALCDDLDDDLPDGLAGWQYGEAIRARGQE